MYETLLLVLFRCRDDGQRSYSDETIGPALQQSSIW